MIEKPQTGGTKNERGHVGCMERLAFSFNDVDSMCMSVRDWSLDFQPLAAPEGNCAGDVVQLFSPVGVITQARFHLPLYQAGSPPRGCVTFVVFGPGMRVLWWRGRDVDADSVLAFPIDGELASISGPDFAVFTLSVHEQDLWELADALEVDVANSNVRPEVFRAPVDVLADVRRRLARAVDGRFGTIDGVLRHCAKLLAPYWLGGRRAHQWRPALALRRHAIRASLELLEAGELETIRPADLTRHAGVSERTLEYAFRERYRLTPAAFVKAIRLARVRQELRNADPVDGRVGEAMAANGFYHVGQFARDYRRLFGELPSTTLAR